MGIEYGRLGAGLVALMIYHGAYFFEILRSQRRVFSAGYGPGPRWRGTFHVTRYTGGLFCRNIDLIGLLPLLDDSS